MDEGRFELDLDNIMTGDDFENLFDPDSNKDSGTDDKSNKDESEDTDKDSEKNKKTNNNEVTTEDELEFDDVKHQEENPEGVGGETDKGQEDPDDSKDSNLPNNIYSSIALTFYEEGILPNLESDDVKNVKDVTSFAEIIDKEVNNRLDATQKRIADALNADIEVSKIQSYEKTLSQLNAVTKEALEDESEKGDNLRKVLIYNDFINRGYSKERAERELKKSLDSGTDIEDATDALQSAKQYYNDLYNSEIEEAKRAKEQLNLERQKQAEQLQQEILNEEKIFDIKLDKGTRQKVFDSISKPVYQDPQTKEYLTAIQKFQREHPKEFLKFTGLFYVLTDSYKNLDKLVGDKVQKETKKQYKKLEQVLNSTSRNPDGSLRFMSGGQGNDTESSFKGFEVDI